ncbi:MAG: dihydrolipoyl dehydrogenase [Lysinibacillus sp.]
MAMQYDVVVLGGGTGGYVAAIRAAKAGLKTAIVEKEKLGGTCLHNGCIPTKSLLKSTEMFKEAQHLEQYGVYASDVSFNFEHMQSRKNAVVDTLFDGVQSLVKKAGVDVYNGTGTILGPSIFSPLPGTISVMNGEEEPQMLLPTTIILATGSRPRTLPFLPFDGKFVVSSDDMLKLDELPQSVMIVGAGVIGVEWASMLIDLGVNVTILEAGSTILPTEDKDIQAEMHKQLTKRGVRILTEAVVDETTLTVAEKIVFNGSDETLQADLVFVAIGREACTNHIGLENTDIQVENGFIVVNEQYQTAESHIFAIGDCIGGMQLAHVATAEGLAAVDYIVHKKNWSIKDHLVPKCIYSSPQIASVGLTEHAAREAYGAIEVQKVPFQAIGKAHSNRSTSGFLKVIVETQYGEIVGIHLIGKDVTELITQGALAMTLNAVPEELTLTVHPHPTLSEVYSEAAFALQKLGIHV